MCKLPRSECKHTGFFIEETARTFFERTPVKFRMIMLKYAQDNNLRECVKTLLTFNETVYSIKPQSNCPLCWAQKDSHKYCSSCLEILYVERTEPPRKRTRRTKASEELLIDGM